MPPRRRGRGRGGAARGRGGAVPGATRALARLNPTPGLVAAPPAQETNMDVDESGGAPVEDVDKASGIAAEVEGNSADYVAQEGDVVALFLGVRSGAPGPDADESGGTPTEGAGGAVMPSPTRAESGGYSTEGGVSAANAGTVQAEAGAGPTPVPEEGAPSASQAPAPGREAAMAEQARQTRVARLLLHRHGAPIGDYQRLAELVREVRAMPWSTEFGHCNGCRRAHVPPGAEPPTCSLNAADVAVAEPLEVHRTGDWTDAFDGQHAACARCRSQFYQCDWMGRVPQLRYRREGAFKMEAYLELRLAGLQPNPTLPWYAIEAELSRLSPALVEEFPRARARAQVASEGRVGARASRAAAAGATAPASAAPATAGPSSGQVPTAASVPAPTETLARRPRGQRGHRAPGPVEGMPGAPPEAFEGPLVFEEPFQRHLARAQQALGYLATVASATSKLLARTRAVAADNRGPWYQSDSWVFEQVASFSNLASAAQNYLGSPYVAPSGPSGTGSAALAPVGDGANASNSGGTLSPAGAVFTPAPGEPSAPAAGPTTPRSGGGRRSGGGSGGRNRGGRRNRDRDESPLEGRGRPAVVPRERSLSPDHLRQQARARDVARHMGRNLRPRRQAVVSSTEDTMDETE